MPVATETARDAFPLEEARADTPGVEPVVHLNNAGAALPPRQVTETMVEHLRREASVGGYEAAAETEAREHAARASVARLVGGEVDEVAIVENATRGWDQAVYGFPFQRRDRVLVGRSEYASNAIALLQLRDRHDLEVVVVDDDEHGQVSLGRLEEELRVGAAMVSLVHVPTGNGLVNPAAEVGRLCAEHGAFFVLDACRSAGQIPLDVADLRCHVLSATGRKFLRGPRGVGFLWVARDAIERLTPPLLDLHAATWTHADRYVVRGDARRFENWERSHAALLGLGTAIDVAHAHGIDAIWSRVRGLADDLRRMLAELSRVDLRDTGRERCGIVTFTVDRVAAADVVSALRRRGIDTSSTSVSSARLDLPPRGIDGGVVRASVHAYNTHDELAALVAGVDEVAFGRRP